MCAEICRKPRQIFLVVKDLMCRAIRGPVYSWTSVQFSLKLFISDGGTLCNFTNTHAPRDRTILQTDSVVGSGKTKINELPVTLHVAQPR